MGDGVRVGVGARLVLMAIAAATSSGGYVEGMGLKSWEAGAIMTTGSPTRDACQIIQAPTMAITVRHRVRESLARPSLTG